MRLLLLILLLPLFSFGQEVKIAEYKSGAWEPVDSFVIKLNQVNTIHGITKFVWDSVHFDTDTTINPMGHDTSGSVVSDVMAVSVTGTTMYTDFMAGGCATVCKSGGCTGCYKKVDCSGCGCNNNNGLCLEDNFGVELPSPFGILAREYLITSVGNEIPKE